MSFFQLGLSLPTWAPRIKEMVGCLTSISISAPPPRWHVLAHISRSRPRPTSMLWKHNAWISPRPAGPKGICQKIGCISLTKVPHASIFGDFLLAKFLSGPTFFGKQRQRRSKAALSLKLFSSSSGTFQLGTKEYGRKIETWCKLAAEEKDFPDWSTFFSPFYQLSCRLFTRYKYTVVSTLIRWIPGSASIRRRENLH